MPIEDSLNNKMRMINGVVVFVEADTAPYASMSQFPIIIGNVKTKMVVVNGLNMIAEGTSKGVRADVNTVRVAMETLAEKVAKGTFAYASVTNNNTLKAIVDWTAPKLHKLQKENVDDVCEAIHDAANAIIAALGGYNVTAADLTALAAAIALYRPLTGKTRESQVDINLAKEQMQTIVSGIMSTELKEQADPLIATLKTTNRGYFDKYQKMRAVLDLANTHAKVRGNVHDEDTEAFINDVIVNLYKVGEAAVYKTTKTLGKGGFSINEVDTPADYDIEWKKTGYITKIEGGVHIGSGKEIKRSVTLKVGTGVTGSRAVVN
jgi:hypothetical protein